jgi:nucleotidyltransferase/DNA polymerase involved in DNA repair
MQWVCFIEVQGLYAAVARRAGLVPQGRPVAVLRDGRVWDGCRDAFAGGLVLGAPARQAQRDAPQAVPVDLAQVDAAAAARAWWDACLNYTPYIEPGEPHQVCLALPSPEGGLTGAVRTEVARLVETAEQHGFVAFAGVGPSKLVARAAARACREGWLLRRPGSQGYGAAPATVAFVLPGDEERYLAPLPVSYLPAPPDVQRRLSRLGLKTIGEAARIPEGEWIRQLGTMGRQVARWCRGIDPEGVRPCYPPRTLEKRMQFAEALRDRDQLESVAGKWGVWLARQLGAKGEGCQQVTLTLEQADGPSRQASRTLQKLQQAAYPIQQALRSLLGEVLAEAVREAGGGSAGESAAGAEGVPADDGPLGPAAGWDAPVAVTALTITLGLIGPMPWQQLDLWDDPNRRDREERLERALTLLHERFPARMVGVGPRQELPWKEQMLQYVDPYRWTRART